MLKKMLATIKENGLIAVGDTVLVALSGGPDSVALFEGLLRVTGRLSFSICAAHLNHKLRGADSDEDERFVRGLAEKRGVPLVVEARDVRGIHKKCGGSIEEVAREVRYEFLKKAAKKCRATKIALGHNLDDNAETFLMNLVRGSGLKGLSGIPLLRPAVPVAEFGAAVLADQGAPESPAHAKKRTPTNRSKLAGGDVLIIRPLLEVTRKEILSFLEREKLSYREDLTNLDISLARNKIRHQLLPLLAAEHNPQIGKVLAETARNLRDAEESVAAAIAELEKTVVWRACPSSRPPAGRKGWHGRDIGAVDLGQLVARPVPLQREFLRRMVQERLGVAIERQTLKHLCELVAGTRAESVPLGRGLIACREYDELLFVPEATAKPFSFEKTLQVPCDIFIPELGIHVEASWLPRPRALASALSARLVCGAQKKPGKQPRPLSLGEVWRRVKRGETQSFEEFFDASAIRGDAIVVRTRREGDAFQPFGMKGTRKVKELFIDEKVPGTLRNRVPIFCSAGDIVWIVGHRPDAKFSLRNSTRRVLRLLVKVLYCPE